MSLSTSSGLFGLLLCAASCGVEPQPGSPGVVGGATASGASATGGSGVASNAGSEASAGAGAVGAVSGGADTGGTQAGSLSAGGEVTVGGGNPGGTAAGGTAAGGAAAGGTAAGGTSGCSALFCEDFETGVLDSTVWSVQASAGQTMKVQSELAAHGRYAVQFHGAPNVVSYDFIIASHLPAALSGHHFGRAYFYVTPKPPEKHTEFLFAGTRGFPKLKYLEVAESGFGWQLTYVQLTDPTGESYTPATGNVPLAKWACLEWEMNDAPDQIHLSVDGVSQVKFDDISFMSQKSGLVGGFSDFGFGYYIWHPATYAFDVYYDDIALDTQPIGCLK